MMEAAGYLASVLIGISLGLMGSGGSILTLPVLVYLFHIEPVPATAYSLGIVGVTSLFGAVTYIRNKLFDGNAALYFGIPSFFAIIIARRFILPAIPAKLFSLGPLVVSRDIFLMIVFAALMSLASFSMIRKKVPKTTAQSTRSIFGFATFILNGTVVGLLTGLVGAGGGFLIIPALINLLKLPIKTAIGTSLIIIAFNALAGFAVSLTTISMNWVFFSNVTLIATAGIFLGNYISKKIDGQKLKSSFGWFILLMGCYIIIKELSR